MKREYFLLGILVFVLIGLNYSWIDGWVVSEFDNSENVFVSRVIDGDTIEVLMGNETKSVRLLGINTPERGEDYYVEAKEFLEDLILNESVSMEYFYEEEDQYGRKLRYVYFGENVNRRLIEEGFANPYFYEKDKYYDDFYSAFGACVENDLRLCEGSLDVCAECVFLEDLDYVEEVVVFRNECSYSCDLKDWSVKDEGRKVFVFPRFNLGGGEAVSLIVAKDGVDSSNELFWKRGDYVWTDSGDSLFLRDEKGKLVFWEHYG